MTLQSSVAFADTGLQPDQHHYPQSCSYARSLPSDSLEGQNVQRSNGNTDRRVIAGRKNTSIRDVKQENQDWLGAQLSRRPVQQVVDSTGMTEKAVQNVRRRKSKLSFDNLVELCRDDPDFAAAFAEHIGLLRPGEAETASAVTRLVNAYQRRAGEGGT